MLSGFIYNLFATSVLSCQTTIFHKEFEEYFIAPLAPGPRTPRPPAGHDQSLPQGPKPPPTAVANDSPPPSRRCTTPFAAPQALHNFVGHRGAKLCANPKLCSASPKLCSDAQLDSKNIKQPLAFKTFFESCAALGGCTTLCAAAQKLCSP